MPETETPPTPAPPAQETPPVDPPAPKETDWKAEARKWEERAKENKTAAERLAELEAANKSELERANDKATAAEKAADKATADALRLRVALKHGISDEDADLFLTGTDEETLTKQAQRLTERVADRKKQGNHVPREGSAPRDPQTDEMREFTRHLFKTAD
jgi:hypothetical protein